MSDFLKSLSARSLGLDEGPETVRPRLPSLFEQPSAASSSINTKMFQVFEATQENSKSTAFEADSIELNWEVAGNGHNRSKESRPQTSAAPQSGGLDANSRADSVKGRLSRSNYHVASQGLFTAPEVFPFDAKISPSSDKRTARVNADRPNSNVFSGNKTVSHSPVLQPPVSTRPVLKPDFKPVETETLTNKRTAKIDLQPEQESGFPEAIQTPILVADRSVLERLIMDKISLHDEDNHPIGRGVDNTSSRLAAILPQAESSTFNAAWPSLKSSFLQTDSGAPDPERSMEPTIQVTIGRIEIRAAPSSNGVRNNPDKKTPTMSLDDYLNKRNRGVQ